MYELVVLRRPKERPEIDESAADLLHRQHLGHFANMTEAGFLKAVGPLAEQPDDSWRGICLYQVGSLE